MVSQRSLHRLAEAIYEELEADGYFDEEPPRRRRATRRSRTRSQRALVPKRKASAANKKYGRVFKRLSPRYKKKNGGWKKDGFARCVRAAHKECRK